MLEQFVIVIIIVGAKYFVNVYVDDYIHIHMYIQILFIY